jgi:ketosteroid isomerase-like protein
MTSETDVQQWVERYVAAWQSNEPADIRALFTEDAVYSGRPHDPEAWHGAEAIVAGWLDHRDDADDWSFEYELLGVAGDRAFVQGVTRYSSTSDYDNLWVFTLTPDGAASDFTEWAVARP